MTPSPQGEGLRGSREPCGTHKCVPYNMIESHRSRRERSPLRSVVSRLWREGWYSPSVMTCGHATSPCTGEVLDGGFAGRHRCRPLQMAKNDENLKKMIEKPPGRSPGVKFINRLGLMNDYREMTEKSTTPSLLMSTATEAPATSRLLITALPLELSL